MSMYCYHFASIKSVPLVPKNSSSHKHWPFPKHYEQNKSANKTDLLISFAQVELFQLLSC